MSALRQNLRIRLATANDAQAIRELTRAAYAKWVPVIGREPLPMLADYNKAVAEHRFDLIEIGGKLAALMETINESDHLLIENLAVSPSFQRMGLGAKLLAHAETIANIHGHQALKLYTNKAFATNITFYSNHGYLIEREDPFLEGYTVFMIKTL